MYEESPGVWPWREFDKCSSCPTGMTGNIGNFICSFGVGEDGKFHGLLLCEIIP